MDEESLIRIIVSAFSGVEISEAKNLLFKSISTTTRNISRRKNKEQKDIEDIICLFKGTDPDKTPIFVAKELQKLPPVTFDHVDVTKLLKDIVLLQSEVKNMKETYATIEYVKKLKTNCDLGGDQARNKDDMTSQQSQNVLFTQKSCIESASSDSTLNAGVQRLSPSTEAPPPPSAVVCAEQQNITIAHVSSDFEINLRSDSEIVEQPMSPSQNVHVTHNMSNDNVNADKMSMADVLRQGGNWKASNTKQEQEWKEFQRRKLRNRQEGVKGKAAIRPEDKFKPADIKVSLFLSNVHKDTSENDIVEYVLSKTKEKISLQKIKMKTEKPYNAYKIIVNKEALNIFLNSEVWPGGVTCRLFRPYRMTVPNGE
ncbi:hypothetical protein PYW07_013455 [Mythimna separata]|uniref:Mutant cadherin n=1 Tax=Mythimna separata TaxID=271217 RepID=A0AAD7Y6A9_MYTSE|nr:hypothetical protein PYW07_013455 [Mythimna separata]